MLLRENGRPRVRAAYRKGNCLVNISSADDAGNGFFDHKGLALLDRHAS